MEMSLLLWIWKPGDELQLETTLNNSYVIRDKSELKTVSEDI